MKKCPYCGELIQDDAIKCRYCDEWLDPVEQGEESSSSSEEKSNLDDSESTPVENGQILPKNEEVKNEEVKKEVEATHKAVDDSEYKKIKGIILSRTGKLFGIIGSIYLIGAIIFHNTYDYMIYWVDEYVLQLKIAAGAFAIFLIAFFILNHKYLKILRSKKKEYKSQVQKKTLEAGNKQITYKKKTRKKTILVIVAIILLGLFIRDKYIDSKIENVTEEFFEAIKKSDESEMKRLYPDIKNFSSYAKSDKIKIHDVSSLGDKKYEVKLKNFFTNGFGKESDSEMTVYVQEKDGNYYIYDSKGLQRFDQSDSLVKYAMNNGFKYDESRRDQDMSKDMKKYVDEIVEKLVQLHRYVEQNITIKDWSWETSSYGDSAHGKGIVVNNTSLPIDKIKYKVTYKTRSGSVVTEDDGYVSYREIPANSSYSFTFYTSYVGNASTANLELQFDEDELIELIVSGRYN